MPAEGRRANPPNIYTLEVVLYSSTTRVTDSFLFCFSFFSSKTTVSSEPTPRSGDFADPPPIYVITRSTAHCFTLPHRYH
ncbi:unnamed protein product [Ectocarpus sp. 4 AP-2014]